MTRHFLMFLRCRPRRPRSACSTRPTTGRRSAGSADAPQPLAGKCVALVFEKASTRTRLSLEVAVAELGGHPVVITAARARRWGAVSRSATRLACSSRMVHAITFRTAGDDRDCRAGEAQLRAGAERADRRQSPDAAPGRLADGAARARPAWGPGVRVDRRRQQHGQLLDRSGRAARRSSSGWPVPRATTRIPASSTAPRSAAARSAWCAIREAAARAPTSISTDVFASMGQEAEQAKRLAAFSGFQRRSRDALPRSPRRGRAPLLARAPRRGDRSRDVLEGPRSFVWDEAEARLHTSKAALVWATRSSMVESAGESAAAHAERTAGTSGALLGCGAPVDPLRAARVAIFNDRFRYFCSASCRDDYDPGTRETPLPRSRDDGECRVPRPDHVVATRSEPSESLDQRRQVAALAEVTAAGSSRPSTTRATSTRCTSNPTRGRDDERECASKLPAADRLTPQRRAASNRRRLALARARGRRRRAQRSPCPWRAARLGALTARLVVVCVAVAALVAEAVTGRRDPDRAAPGGAARSAPIVAAAPRSWLASRHFSDFACDDLGGHPLRSRASQPYHLADSPARSPSTRCRARADRADALATGASRRRGRHRVRCAQRISDPGEEIVIEPGEAVPVDATITAGTVRVVALARQQDLGRARSEGDTIVAGAVVLEGACARSRPGPGSTAPGCGLTNDPRRRADLFAPRRALGARRRSALRRSRPVSPPSPPTPLTNDPLAIVMFAVGSTDGAGQRRDRADRRAARDRERALGAASWHRVPLRDGARRGGPRRRSRRSARAARSCSGEPEVANVEPIGNVEPERVLALVAGAESGATQPVATAVMRAARVRGVRPDGVRSPNVQPGLGVTAVASNGQPLVVGSRALMLKERVSVAAAEPKITELEAMGRSVLLVAARRSPGWRGGPARRPAPGRARRRAAPARRGCGARAALGRRARDLRSHRARARHRAHPTRGAARAIAATRCGAWPTAAPPSPWSARARATTSRSAPPTSPPPSPRPARARPSGASSSPPTTCATRPTPSAWPTARAVRLGSACSWRWCPAFWERSPLPLRSRRRQWLPSARLPAPLRRCFACEAVRVERDLTQARAGAMDQRVKSGAPKDAVDTRQPDRDRLRRDLGAYMEQRGLRSTEQRRLIIEKLFETSEHVTIDQLLEAVRAVDSRVGYATVYRTMKLLAEGGLVHERKFGDGFTRYELADEQCSPRSPDLPRLRHDPEVRRARDRGTPGAHRSPLRLRGPPPQTRALRHVRRVPDKSAADRLSRSSRPAR